jgi:hypothetical protein
MITFHWLPQNQNKPLHPKEVLAIKDRLTHASSWVASFLLPCDSPRVGERSFDPIVTQLPQLPVSYHQYAIGIFNTCSQGPTHRSLTDTDGGYNLRGVGLLHTHSPTFPTSYLHFPLMAPLGLHFNQVLTTKLKY